MTPVLLSLAGSEQIAIDGGIALCANSVPAVQLDHNLVGAVVVHFFELSDITWLQCATTD